METDEPPFFGDLGRNPKQTKNKKKEEAQQDLTLPNCVIP